MTFVSQKIPPGTMLLWGGGAGQYSSGIALPGWLYCDGTTVSKSTYSALYATIGDRYNTGGEAAGTFRLPGVAGYMTKGTTASTNTEHVSNASTHNHTIVNTSGLGVNATSGSGSSHGHGSFSNNTNQTHTSHALFPVPSYDGTAGNSGVAGRVSGSVNISIAAHTHALTSTVSSNSANWNAHPTTVNAANESSHTHTISASFTPGTPTSDSSTQPTMALWHIIKI